MLVSLTTGIAQVLNDTDGPNLDDFDHGIMLLVPHAASNNGFDYPCISKFNWYN